MRIFLTGGSGFLGSRLLPALVGHEVMAITRDAAGIPDLPHTIRLEADLGAASTWVGPVHDFQPDACIHLAWQGLPDYSADACRRNVNISLRLFDEVTAAGAKRVVMAGSCWEYGQRQGPVSESDEPVRPGLFAASKIGLMEMLKALAAERGFDWRWARIFFVYGTGQRSTSLIPALDHAYRSGEPPAVRTPAAIQDFVHVEDVASALVRLVEWDGGSGLFNVGSGEGTSAAGIANRVAEAYQAPKPFPAIEPGSGFWADLSRMRDEVGWEPRTDLDQGIRETIAGGGNSRAS